MKFLKTLLILLFAFNYSNAQLGGLFKKVSKKVERKVDRKVDQKIDKEVDKAFDKKNPAKKIPALYQFDYEFEIEIGNKNNMTPMVFLINLKEDVVATKEVSNGEVTIILNDHKRKKSIIYIEGNGTKARSNMPYINSKKMASKVSNKSKNQSSIKATGKTKTIAGYECQEYFTESKKYQGYLYLTTEVEVEAGQIFGLQNIPVNDFMKESANIESGFMMGMVMYKKKSPDTIASSIECKSLKKGSYKINNLEYYPTN